MIKIYFLLSDLYYDPKACEHVFLVHTSYKHYFQLNICFALKSIFVHNPHRNYPQDCIDTSMLFVILYTSQKQDKRKLSNTFKLSLTNAKISFLGLRV